MPDPAAMEDAAEQDAANRALFYMDLVAGTPIREIPVDTVFIGSCTNGRIEDLRAAADVLRGRTTKAGMRAMVVPGSHRVKAQAESEGLDEVFTGRRVRVAAAGLFDVPGHEPGQAGPRRAGGVHLQPELRGAAGPGRPDPPGLPRRGRGHRGGRPLRLPEDLDS